MLLAPQKLWGLSRAGVGDFLRVLDQDIFSPSKGLIMELETQQQLRYQLSLSQGVVHLHSPLSECDLCFAAGILDTAIVDRGRNVLSCSRDGTARLWDCGKSACLGVIADCGSPINGIAVGTADDSLNLGTPEKPPSKDLALKIPLRSPVPNCLGLSPIILSVWLAALCPWDGVTRTKNFSPKEELSLVNQLVMKTGLPDYWPTLSIWTNVVIGLAGVIQTARFWYHHDLLCGHCWN